MATRAAFDTWHCALCGGERSQRRGGLIPFVVRVQDAQRQGIKLRSPTSAYTHLGCARRLKAKLTEAQR